MNNDEHTDTRQREMPTQIHRVTGNRWKHSADNQTQTHEEGQVTWNERRVTFQNKTGNDRTRHGDRTKTQLDLTAV